LQLNVKIDRAANESRVYFYLNSDSDRILRSVMADEARRGQIWSRRV